MEQADRGFLALNRDAYLNNSTFMKKPFDDYRAWNYLLMVANYKDTILKIKGQDIPLRRGQLAYSIKHLSKIWGWNIKRVRRFLKQLEKSNQVSYKKFPEKGFTVTTITTILVYDEYSPLFKGDTVESKKRDTVKTQIYSREKAEKTSQRDTVRTENRDTDNNTIPIKKKDNLYNNKDIYSQPREAVTIGVLLHRALEGKKIEQ